MTAPGGYLIVSKMDDGVGWEAVRSAPTEEEAKRIKFELIAEGYDGTLMVVEK